MTVAVDAIYLPVPSKVGKPLTTLYLKRQRTHDQHQVRRHRAYLKPPYGGKRFEYSSYGDPITQSVKGRNVNLYI